MALFLLESKDDERQDNLLKNPLLLEFTISRHTGFKLVN